MEGGRIESPDYYTQQKLSFTIDGENKIFHDNTRFKHYVSTKPALQKVLEGKPLPKEANYTHKNTGNR